jgi:Na+/H+ antiporter NhaD/arsenite permease-like protein
MVVLLLLNPSLSLEHVLTRIELTLLIFFVGLFMVVGGVEHSGFL